MSWCMVPSVSDAVTTNVFWPSVSFTGRFRAIAGSWVRFSCRQSSTPFALIRTCRMPLPPLTTPANVTVSWSTRAWLVGVEIEMRKPGGVGLALGGIAATTVGAPAGCGGVVATGGAAARAGSGAEGVADPGVALAGGEATTALAGALGLAGDGVAGDGLWGETEGGLVGEGGAAAEGRGSAAGLGAGGGVGDGGALGLV